MVVQDGRTSREQIRKPRRGWAVPPNLVDYAAARAQFTWDDARRLVSNAMALMVEVDRALTRAPRRKE